MEYLSQHALVFCLVLMRVGGLVLTVPLFGSTHVPARVRAVLAFALAALVAPLEWQTAFAAPGSLVNFAVFAASELLLGVALGLGVVMLLSAMQLAGQISGQMSGLQLAEVFDPGFDAPIPVFSQMLMSLGLALFVLVGGHRMLMQALLDSFVAMPPGSALVSSSVTDTLTVVLAQSFSLGVRVAVPALVALLLSTLILALVGRTLPQLNFTTIGFGINSLVTYAVLALSLGAIAWAFSDEIEPVLDMVTEAVRLNH